MEAPVRQLLFEKGSEVHTIWMHESVCDAVSKMNAQHIGALVVMDGNRPVGMFSERDVLERVLICARTPHDTKVREVMTPELVSISPSTTVREAMRVVTETRCRHLPVMSGNQLVGLISSGDLTRWMVRDQQMFISDLERYICSG